MNPGFRRLRPAPFTALLCFTLPFIFMMISGCVPARQPVPKAKDGVLDLSGFDLENSGPLELDSGWRLFPNRLISPEEFTGSHEALEGKTLSGLPAWDDDENRPASRSDEISATIRMTVSGVPETCRPALRVGTLDEACRIWVNGSLVYENGRIHTDSAPGYPGRPELTLVPLVGGGPDFDLVIHLSRFTSVSYNHGFAVSIGDETRMADTISREKASLLFFVTLLLATGVYHLILCFFRRRDPALLYFSLFCFCWMLEKGANDLYYWLTHFFMPDVSLPLMERLNIISYGFSLPLSFLFIRELFPDETPGFLPKIYLILISGLSVWLLFDLSACGLIYTCIQYTVLSTIVPMTAVFIAAVRAGRQNSLVMLAGISIAALFGVLHTLSVLGIISVSGHLAIDTGLLCIILSQAVCLARKFAWSFNATEDLSLKLQQANTDLKKLDRLKDEFLANTTHELLTPLSGIIGLAESMMADAAGKLPESAVDNLRMMAVSGKRLNGLVRNILDFSRLKIRDIRLDPTPLDLPTAVKTVVTLVQPLAEAGNLRLASRFEKELPPVLADENRLHQILFNLIGNAVKYTKAGEILVTAEMEGPYIRIDVSDTGIGIPEEKKDLVFSRFEQAHPLSSTGAQGTGLGLSISKQLVELHGGEIGFHNREGGGTTFFFTLPVAGEASAPPPPGPSAGNNIRKEVEDPFSVAFPGPVKPVVETGGHRETVLVVDDDPVNIQVGVNHLKTEGFRVLTARGGKEALDMLPAGRKPDLVLLDIMMPEMDGYETCRRIRQTHSMSDLPVIFLTARVQVHDMVSGFDAGANDYLTKPFSREELLARVRTQISIRRSYKVLKENTRLKKEIERRKITELDLKMMQQRLARILDFLDDAIIAVNENFEICFSNTSFCRLTGYPDRELLGLPAGSLFRQTEKEPPTGPETFSLQPGEPVRIRRNDGSMLNCPVETADLEIEGETLQVIVVRNTEGGNGPTDAISFIEKLGLNGKQIEHLKNTLASSISFFGKEDQNADTTEVADATGEDGPETDIARQGRRELGATIMNQALDLWARETGATKVDLAEQSGIWKVYMNCNGFERTQTLDKYLSAKTFPKNPRWPKVYRTVEYVLAGCAGKSRRKKALEASYEVLRRMV
jgi:two-component system sensor histidine kinase ChiS